MILTEHEVRAPTWVGAPQRLRFVRGDIVTPQGNQRAMELRRDHVLSVDEAGRISSLEPAPKDCEIPVTRPGSVWLPGFVDTHVHCPQTRVIGSASGPLLDWLKTSIFPEESRFADREYAAAVAEVFCRSLIAQGTTTAAVYSTSHVESTDALFQAMFDAGLRGLVGLTLMNRAAPASLCLSTADAMRGSERLIERWHLADDGRLEFCVTPRFAISCTPDLLIAAGELARRFDLPVQTHISENHAEIAETAALFPDARDYLDVYERVGLTTSRTILAHCIHFDDSEWKRAAALGCGVSHCPDSNFFLGSGLMPLDKARTFGLKIGLGSDVGAGRTFSIRRVAASAFDTAKLTGAETSSEELLWYATAGGARVLGLEQSIGALQPGWDADMVAIDLTNPHLDDVATLCDQLVFRHDAGPVAAAYVRGRRLGGA